MSIVWATEGTGAFTSWNDLITLTRRKNGTFTLGVRRIGIDDPGTSAPFRSRPFRSGQKFFEALDGCSDAMDRDGRFDLAERLLLLSELVDADPKLAVLALRELSKELWDPARRRPRSGFWNIPAA